MVIRLATEMDVPGLLALLKQVGQVHHDIRPDIFPEHTLKYDAIALQDVLQDKARPIFVAVEGENVAGYCFCVHKEQAASSVSTQRRELYIDDLCVDENCRNRGIAGVLYRYACDYAKAGGCDFITLNVWCGNDNAIRFYEKAGMTPRSVTMEMKL